MTLKEIFLPWLAMRDLKRQLADARKNDHRDPVTGRFAKRPK